MNIEKTSNLSFYNEQGILTLTAKQFDTGRMFVFHIMHNDAPFDLSGCTAYLRIAKADGTQFQGHECCTIEGSKVIIKTNTGNGSQILTAAGTNVCELHLEDSDGISLTTWTFHIVVEPRVHDGSNMSSIDSYDVLDNMINMEKERIANEKQRLENELQRKENEANRNTVFKQKIDETNAVITDCRLVINAANQKINSFEAEINEIVDGITDEAQSYAHNAKESETNAANAACNAEDSATAASQKASDAAASAVLSQSYAVGGTGIREGEDSDNAKEYAKQAKASADELRNGYILKTEKGASEGVATLDSNGKIPEEQLPDNIGSVTGVKGDKENAYRTGDVNLTPENIGALSLTGGTVNGKTTFNSDVTVDNLNISRETIDSYGIRYLFKLKGVAEVSHDSYLNIMSYDTQSEETYNVYINGREIKIIDYDNVTTKYRYDGSIITEYLSCNFGVSSGNDYKTVYTLSWSTFFAKGKLAIDLGDSTHKWKNIYATNGTIQTSDRKEKNTIEELSSEKAQQLIYGLKPSTYQMNAGTSGRTHWGMISQDIEELFDKIDMTSLDFAGFIKSPKMTEEVRDEETGKIIKESEIIEGEYDYSLRYDEFIAPIIKVIQTQHEEIETLTKKINFLEQQTNNCQNQTSRIAKV